MLRWITIALAVIGVIVGVVAVSTSKEEPPKLDLARPPSVNPFDHGVAALGIVEPASRTIAIVPPEAALVTEVLVDVNDPVQAGQPLFRLDTRTLQAQMVRAQSSVAVGQAEIDRWHALPRAEDLPPLEAAVARAQAVYNDRTEQSRLNQEARASSAATSREVTFSQFAVDAAQADLARAKADLEKARAGGWKPDLAAAQANLARLKAEVGALQILMDRMTVRAPRAAVVLRRQIEPGELAALDSAKPSLILGDLTGLRIRAEVDEEDIALVGKAPKAVARTRGVNPKEIALRLVRIEPFGRPKTDLLGTTVERVDTRVIDVVFEVVDAVGATLYPGQAVDVFIEAATRE